MARNYAGDPDGWLVLLGRTGCGKTHLAAAIVHHEWQAAGGSSSSSCLTCWTRCARHTAEEDVRHFDCRTGVRTAPPGPG